MLGPGLHRATAAPTSGARPRTGGLRIRGRLGGRHACRAPEDPAGGGSAVARAAGADAVAAPAAPSPGGQQAGTATMQPTVKSEWEKTPRNAPCPCGSGKKFKLCHGRS